jgi:hypothetical protein
LRDQDGRCGTCRCDWLHCKTVGVLHGRRTTEKDAAVGVTRHNRCCARNLRTTSNNVLCRSGTRATSTNPSLAGVIGLQSIRPSQFGEADKRAGMLPRPVCLTFFSGPSRSEPQGGPTSSAAVICLASIYYYCICRGAPDRCVFWECPR